MSGMSRDVIKIIGKNRGKTSIILAGVHGNEKCGVIAFKKILPNLNIENGVVYFCYANPKAIKKNVRFTDANLNRMFKNDKLLSTNEKRSYEYNRAQFLKKYLDEADALLDIHASGSPDSIPFIISERNAKKIIEHLPISLSVSGFDNVEPGGTDYYMNSIGKIGICIECGYIADVNSTLIAKKSIDAFLKAQGHIVNNLKPRKLKKISVDTLYSTKTNNFSLSKPFADFEKIKKGQTIGIDGKKIVKAKKDGVILFARNRDKIGSEGFLFGKILK